MAIAEILAGTAIEAGTSYLGGKSQKKAADKASKYALAEYLQRRKDVTPYMEAGETSSNLLAQLMDEGYFDTEYDPSKIAEDPAYQFRLGEGRKAIDRGSAASGEFFSGQRGKALTRFGQNLAAEEYAKGYGRDVGEKSRKFSRLYDVGGRGYSAASGLQQPGMGRYELAKGDVGAGMYGDIGGAAIGGVQNYMIDKYLNPGDYK